MKTFIAAILLVIGFSCQAQTVGLHTFSAHQHGGYSNFDPGVYVRTESGWTAGVYRNSYRRMSAYAGYTWETSGTISFAVTAGVVTGYPAARVMPLLVPSVAVHFGDDAVRVGIVPKPPSHGTSASLHLMFEHSF